MASNVISCRVIQLNNVKPEDNVFPWYVFSFDISTTFLNSSNREIFLVHRAMMLDDETSRSTLHDLLLEMNVPVLEDDVLVTRILDCVTGMATAECLKRRKILRLRVEIDVRLSLDDDNVEAEEDDVLLNVTPASESSIEALEKVRVDGEIIHNNCVICLQQILIGSEATRLPCSHHYHDNCIRIWLKSNGVCPLCRFRIHC